MMIIKSDAFSKNAGILEVIDNSTSIIDASRSIIDTSRNIIDDCK
jgi:hypothetical protein